MKARAYQSFAVDIYPDPAGWLIASIVAQVLAFMLANKTRPTRLDRACILCTDWYLREYLQRLIFARSAPLDLTYVSGFFFKTQ